MKLSIIQSLETEGLDGWIVSFHEGECEGPGAKVDKALDGVIREALENKAFEAKPNSTFWVRPLGKLPVRCIVAVGLGKRDHSIQCLHRAYAVGARALREAGCRRIGLLQPPAGELPAAAAVQALAEGVVMGLYEFQKYKSADDPHKEVVEAFIEGAEALRDDLDRGRVVAEAANFCRDLNNEPPALATPAYVADIARAMQDVAIAVTVLDENDLADKGMNAILAVGQGSVHPPRIVGLEYRGGAPDAPLYAVVGKGVTFDSGGLSLKPSQSMEDMKFDKSGACAVLGIIKACRDLRLPVNVLGVAGLAENLPGSRAYRPGDIIRAGNGKTIEILNTDAEGRVVLADALYFAGTHKPVEMVDLATLTGACVVALGDLCAGLMGNDNSLIRELLEAGERTGERVWQLPLWPEYDEKVKSGIADLKNIGERSGGTGMAGAIAGASFLKAFVPEDCRWAHIDIAGTANDGKKQPWRAAGATGFGVRIVVEWLRQKARSM